MFSELGTVGYTMRLDACVGDCTGACRRVCTVSSRPLSARGDMLPFAAVDQCKV